MVSFIVYDVIFLVLFVLFVAWFLYTRRHNLKKEGLLLLYRTKWGIKFINYIGSKYTKTLQVLSYVSIFLGYILMAGVLWLIGRVFWIYVSMPAVVQQIKVPPIMPIIPYIDKVVPGFPSFYFTYFILILAVIAITHEFAHGIFSVHNKVKIKKTGFGFFPSFLPVFLAAFVEPDEKQMQKKSKFSQMAILSAGTFANFLTAIFFFVILLGFFSAAFQPAGVTFDNYAFEIINTSSVIMINNVSLENPTYEEIISLTNITEFDSIKTSDNKNYLGILDVSSDTNHLVVYIDSPALENKIGHTITDLEGEKITSLEKLSEEISKYSPGDSVTITALENYEEKIYEVVLSGKPENPEEAWLGIYFTGSPATIENHRTIIPFIGENNIFYKTNNNFFMFIQNLLEWLILISLSVALINMLPVGIFDGGRFFYLTIWGITKNEKIGRKAFTFMTSLFLALLAIMMLAWVINLFF
ncbi:site-2 protease family protein [Candidatus Pacearchaeota archaeon]|nr:site-2 protease family protein [Candidatus Pacearchaeota archaeon]